MEQVFQNGTNGTNGTDNVSVNVSVSVSDSDSDSVYCIRLSPYNTIYKKKNTIVF